MVSYSVVGWDDINNKITGQQKQSISRCRLGRGGQAVNDAIKTKTKQKLFSSGCDGCENQLIRTKLSLQTITHTANTGNHCSLNSPQVQQWLHNDTLDLLTPS